MTPLETLLAQWWPNVKPTGDKNIFLVRSRSSPNVWRRVDAQGRFGIGICNCPDNQKNKNPSCHHIQSVRGWIMQVTMYSEIKKDLNGGKPSDTK
jgi:hypothetical protein